MMGCIEPVYTDHHAKERSPSMNDVLSFNVN